MAQSLKDLIPALAQIATELANNPTERNQAELRSRIFTKLHDKAYGVVLSFLVDIFRGNPRDLGEEVHETVKDILPLSFPHQLLTDILK